MSAKRVLDGVAATAALVGLSPLMVAIAFAVRLSSTGPALHRSRRVGRNGELFTLFKFRSMRLTTDVGPAITAGGDARVTSVGRVLRASKLDELPQLWNVLRGEMSLVGPRPEDPRFVELYSVDQRRLLAWRPGLTSPASVLFRDEESILARQIASGCSLEEAYQEVLNTKLAMELAYFPQATIVGDLRWMWRTVAAVLRRRPMADQTGG